MGAVGADGDGVGADTIEELVTELRSTERATPKEQNVDIQVFINCAPPSAAVCHSVHTDVKAESLTNSSGSRC